MSPSPFPRPLGRLLLAVLAAALLPLWHSGPAAADSAVTPDSKGWTISGSGFGHGWGMSQWGAYGAASKGLDFRRILAFYYPGTTVSKVADRDIRVWITADSDGSLQTPASAGLRVAQGSRTVTLPTGSAHAEWRVRRSGSAFVLESRARSGSWRSYKPSGVDLKSVFRLHNDAGRIDLVLPSGSRPTYRGSLELIAHGSSARTVNRLGLDAYLGGVVPAEMPTSWHPEAVRAQAVAARTYAARLRSVASGSYDVCDTTACQVYRGVDAETSGGNAAVKATAGLQVLYRGAPALTQFSASNGGARAKGDFAYLTAGADPYDGVRTSQAWTVSLSKSAVQARYPSVGTPSRIQIRSRDGSGAWGGRVVSLTITGSRGSTTVSGSAFRAAFGLRSNLFTVTGAPVAAPKPTPAPTTKPPTAPSSPTTRAAAARAKVVTVDSQRRIRTRTVTGTRAGASSKTFALGRTERQVVAVGDWNRDGHQDVVVLTRTYRLHLVQGTATGWGKRSDLGRTVKARLITGIGDYDGDGKVDLLVVTTGGDLQLVRGDGGRRIISVTTLARKWQNRTALVGIGDFNRDGRVDFLSRVGDVAYLHLGRGSAITRTIRLGTGWRTLAISAAGDLTGDGRSDLVTRSSAGRWTVHHGNGANGFTRRSAISGFLGSERPSS